MSAICDLCFRDVTHEPHTMISDGFGGEVVGCLACDIADWKSNPWRQKAFPTPPKATDYADWMENSDVCERCGEYGTMKHGDPDDCRSADCMGDKCDAAMDAMEDR